MRRSGIENLSEFPEFQGTQRGAKRPLECSAEGIAPNKPHIAETNYQRHNCNRKQPPQRPTPTKKSPSDRCAFCACESERRLLRQVSSVRGPVKTWGLHNRSPQELRRGNLRGVNRSKQAMKRGLTSAVLLNPQQLPHLRKRNPLRVGALRGEQQRQG